MRNKPAPNAATETDPATLSVLQFYPHPAVPGGVKTTEVVPIPAGSLDFARDLVRYHDGEQRLLSRMEVALLRYLVAHANTTVSRAALLRDVWRCNPDVVLTRTVDMHVAMVRRKLKDDARDPAVLLTVSGRGYLFRQRSGPMGHDSCAWRMAG